MKLRCILNLPIWTRQNTHFFRFRKKFPLFTSSGISERMAINGIICSWDMTPIGVYSFSFCLLIISLLVESTCFIRLISFYQSSSKLYQWSSPAQSTPLFCNSTYLLSIQQNFYIKIIYLSICGIVCTILCI